MRGGYLISIVTNRANCRPSTHCSFVRSFVVTGWSTTHGCTTSCVCLLSFYEVPYGPEGVVLRGTIVIRTHDIHKNLYITQFLPSIFGPDYYVLPEKLWRATEDCSFLPCIWGKERASLTLSVREKREWSGGPRTVSVIKLAYISGLINYVPNIPGWLEGSPMGCTHGWILHRYILCDDHSMYVSVFSIQFFFI